MKSVKNAAGAKGRVILHMIASDFHLDGKRGAALTQMHLLKITLDGYKVKDLEQLVQRIDKCLNALCRRDRPRESTMLQFLFDRLRHLKRLRMTIEDIKDSGTRLRRRISNTSTENSMSPSVTHATMKTTTLFSGT